MDKIIINGRTIGEGMPAYIIAEMSANHAGSIAHAREIIHAAKEAGADCVKIQTYTADTMTIDSDKSYFQIEDGTWKGENLYHLYERAYTPWEWQEELKEEVKEKMETGLEGGLDKELKIKSGSKEEMKAGLKEEFKEDAKEGIEERLGAGL